MKPGCRPFHHFRSSLNWWCLSNESSRIHRGDQEKAGWVLRAPAGAHDGDVPRLQRLAQSLERGPGEFREFVEEQDTMVGQRDLAGPRVRHSRIICRALHNYV